MSSQGCEAEAQPVRCASCKRPLRAAASIAALRGRRCRAKVRAEARAAAGHNKPEQVAKAVQLIEDGGLVPTNRPGIYRAVSSNGEVTYLVAAQACSCRAGVHDRLCYHRIGVAILEAARPARRAA